MIKITHIHPMLIHFPIVLFFVALLLFLYMQATGKDMNSGKCLAMTAVSALMLATMFAIVAAFFGDIALDAAVEKGFATEPLEEHETLAGITIGVFGVLSLVQVFAVWKKISMGGLRGWIFVLFMLAGFGSLVATAYHGGELVYKYGVNVDPVKPEKKPAPSM